MSHTILLNDALVQVKVPRGERRRWRAAARREGLTLSEFVRALVRERLTAAARLPQRPPEHVGA